MNRFKSNFPSAKKATSILTVLAMVLTCAAASAAPINWTLNNVTFVDQGTATGSFIFDADLGQVLSWSLSTQGGSTAPFAPGPNPYDSAMLGHTASVSNCVESPQCFNFQNGAPNFDLRLGVLAPLTNAGGIVTLGPLHPGNSSGFATNFECVSCSPFRNIASGTLDAAVPEPTTILLLGLGLAGLGFARRRLH